MSLCVVDGDEFPETESTWICVIHRMNFIVSPWVVSGDEFFGYIEHMTLHMSLFFFRDMNHLPHRAH